LYRLPCCLKKSDAGTDRYAKRGQLVQHDGAADFACRTGFATNMVQNPRSGTPNAIDKLLSIITFK
jgi:hypothetical protein